MTWGISLQHKVPGSRPGRPTGTGGTGTLVDPNGRATHAIERKLDTLEENFVDAVLDVSQ
ncbi:MAG: hypothetical protein ACYCPT_10420 [Acidimicrobiales bacterium]